MTQLSPIATWSTRWAFVLVALALGLPSALAERQINGIAVIVNKKIITWEDVFGGARSLLRDPELQRQYQLERRSAEEILASVEQDSVDLLVERELVLHEFETSEFQFPENIIQKEITRRMRRDFGDRVNMMKTLREQGRNLESLRRQIRDEFIFQAMVHRNVSSGILVSPYKIQTYYEENQDQFNVPEQIRLRMIFLAYLPTRTPEATRRLADEILAKLKQDVPFTEMAAVYSDGTQRAEGGDQGWLDLSAVDTDLLQHVADLEPGNFSEVLDKETGCYILFLEGKKDAQVRPLTEVRDEIERTLQVREEQRLRKQWIERLKTKSFTEFFPLRPPTP